jgi:hypothetical protein
VNLKHLVFKARTRLYHGELAPDQDHRIRRRDEGARPPQHGPGGGGERRSSSGVSSAGAPLQGGSTSARSPVQAGHQYNLSISMSVRNLLNHTNPGLISGNITSPLFGQANQPAGGSGFIFSEAAITAG